MAKKGPLSKVEIFYIEGQLSLGADPKVIAQDLERTQTSVQNYIKKNFHPPKKETGLTAGSQFISQNGATIMTENASTLSDSTRKLIRKQAPCVTKIK